MEEGQNTTYPELPKSTPLVSEKMKSFWARYSTRIIVVAIAIVIVIVLIALVMMYMRPVATSKEGYLHGINVDPDSYESKRKALYGPPWRTI